MGFLKEKRNILRFAKFIEGTKYLFNFGKYLKVKPPTQLRIGGLF